MQFLVVGTTWLPNTVTVIVTQMSADAGGAAVAANTPLMLMTSARTAKMRFFIGSPHPLDLPLRTVRPMGSYALRVAVDGLSAPQETAGRVVVWRRGGPRVDALRASALRAGGVACDPRASGNDQDDQEACWRARDPRRTNGRSTRRPARGTDRRRRLSGAVGRPVRAAPPCRPLAGPDPRLLPSGRRIMDGACVGRGGPPHPRAGQGRQACGTRTPRRLWRLAACRAALI